MSSFHRHAFSLLDESFTTVEVVFPESTKSYTYKIPKEWAEQAAFSSAIVEVNDTLKIVKIVAVHSVPQIDVNLPTKYRWIVQLIDRTAYDAFVRREAEFEEFARESLRQEQRRKFLESIPGAEQFFLPKETQA